MARKAKVDTDTLFTFLEEQRADQNVSDAELVRQLRDCLARFVMWYSPLGDAKHDRLKPLAILAEAKHLLGDEAGAAALRMEKAALDT